jgi:hypothetical protein
MHGSFHFFFVISCCTTHELVLNRAQRSRVARWKNKNTITFKYT